MSCKVKPVPDLRNLHTSKCRRPPRNVGRRKGGASPFPSAPKNYFFSDLQASVWRTWPTLFQRNNDSEIAPRIRQSPPKDGSAPNYLAETDQPQFSRLRR